MEVEQNKNLKQQFTLLEEKEKVKEREIQQKIENEKQSRDHQLQEEKMHRPKKAEVDGHKVY
jgi:membrane protein involved in colicin uptake